MKDRDTIKGFVDEAEKQQGETLRITVLIAEQKRVFYQSLINEGFTEEQALELTKHYP